MNFFCTKEHIEQWTKKRSFPDGEVFRLEAPAALRVAAMLFRSSPPPTGEASNPATDDKGEEQ